MYICAISKFNLRAIVAYNHTTNVNAFKQLRHLHGIGGNTHVIRNPYCSGKAIYLQFDIVHLLKNIRNNLQAIKCFETQEFKFHLPILTSQFLLA